MKFGKLIENKKKIFLIKYQTENEAERIVPDLFFVSEKVFYEVKASRLHLVSISFDGF